MTKELDGEHFSRLLKVDEIRQEASGKIEASGAEMAAIARVLELVALDGLIFSYRLRHAGKDRLHLTGTLKAKVTQHCVVTLDPVATELEIPVETEFWPVHLIEEFERRTEGRASPDEADWPEPIEDGKIDLGPLIYETLATGLDPYPKREGASFDWPQQGADQGSRAPSGPFAALKQLKQR
jgi:uncharacterized metal-binding protein YceD (DUF177 family)